MSSLDWLPVFRAIATQIRAVVPPLAGTTRGRQVIGLGAGGDQTIYLDQLAEQIVVEHLERAYRSGFRFQLISEELGERDFGGETLILVDPLDGSFNAKMGLPYYAVVLAATQGDRFQDVGLGYVQNLVTGDEFHAVAGAGAFRNELPLRPDPPAFDGRTIPLVQVDAPSGIDPREGAAPIVARAEKIRQLGSAALNLCHTAAGGIALQATPAPVRAFDLAGPLLILREAGGVATDFGGRSVESVSVRLDSRTTLLASLSPAIHRFALELLGARVS
ncbi:MAG TPA: inositol monophosphatase family protein [Candidatus Dormibacteraeota bacterium]|nr:inositol monophosphatase family protein [Candidatus Dormibacteraeota bacterium]